MGLDHFRTEDENNETEDESQDGKEETTSDSESSGLDSFRTDPAPTGSGSENNEERQDEKMFNIPPNKWNQMTTDQRVKYVRANHIPDYYPEYKIEDGWEYVNVAKVRCVCGAIFMINPLSSCFKCGRTYEKTDRTVIQKHDIDENNEY
jgi:hypothetical protein